MRSAVAFAVLALGVAGATDARAADLPLAPAVGPAGYVAAQRAGVVWTWSDEPGTVIRAYWLPPWQDRHYFPATGKPPRIGRLERLPARVRPVRAESYHRSWSTAPGVRPAWTPSLDDDGAGPAPSVEPPLK